MKILYVITLPDLGGAQTHLLEVLRFMHRNGHQVMVVVGRSGWLTEQLDMFSLEYIILPELVREISPAKDMAALKSLRHIIRQYRPDLVHCHSSKAGILGRIAAWQENIPVVFTAHGWAFTEGVSTIKRLVYATVERAMLHITAKVLCVSDYDRRLAARCFMYESSKVITVHNGIADIEYKKCILKKKSNMLRVVTVARFSPQKKNLELIQAVETLDKAYPNQIETTLVGNGPLWKECRDYAGAHKLDKFVHLLGQRDDVQELLEQQDIFCLVSNYEGLPISIIEAMREGLPIIASDVGGCNELVQNGVNGFLIERGNGQQLYERLEYMLKHPDVLIKMGKASRKLYEDRFSADIMNNKILAVYQSIVG